MASAPFVSATDALAAAPTPEPAPGPSPGLWPTFLWYLTAIYHIFLEPALTHLGLVKPGFGDPTYGRASIPPTKAEREHILDNPDIEAVERTVHLSSEALRKGGSWEKPGQAFVFYQVWTSKKVKDRGADVVLLHGINNYGSRTPATGVYFAERGFRTIVIDLPSFGRSSGLHAHLPSMRMNVEATHACLRDIAHHDGVGAQGARKTFLFGESMGGFTALYYAALYPPAAAPVPGEPETASTAIKELRAPELRRRATNASTASEANDDLRPNLAGVAVAAPMIAISKHSYPPKVVEYIARVIVFFAGRLPMAKGVKGNVSKDIRVETDFHADPKTYKGYLRIATGMAILQGLSDLQALAPRVSCPVAIHHGTADRATDHRGSVEFFQRISSEDKELKLWPDGEHALMKLVEGMDEEDHRKRNEVLDAVASWFERQVDKQNGVHANGGAKSNGAVKA